MTDEYTHEIITTIKIINIFIAPKVPLSTLSTTPASPLPRPPRLSSRISLHFLEFYISGIIQNVLFFLVFHCPPLFWDLPMLLCVSMHACSVASNSATPWTVVHYALLFMGFPRQEYWGGLPFPPPGDRPDSGIEPESRVSCVGRWILHHYWQIVLVLLSLVLILLSPPTWIAVSPYVRIIWLLLCLQMPGADIWLMSVNDWRVEALRAAVWFGLSSFPCHWVAVSQTQGVSSARIWRHIKQLLTYRCNG